MTLIYADRYVTAYMWAQENQIDEWAYVAYPDDLARHRDFRLIALTPLTKGMEYAIGYARACGGRVVVG